jgi:hypothetical protein
VKVPATQAPSIRFVLGEKLAALLAVHAATIDFLAPDTALEEATAKSASSVQVRRDRAVAQPRRLEIEVGCCRQRVHQRQQAVA